MCTTPRRPLDPCKQPRSGLNLAPTSVATCLRCSLMRLVSRTQICARAYSDRTGRPAHAVMSNPASTSPRCATGRQTRGVSARAAASTIKTEANSRGAESRLIRIRSWEPSLANASLRPYATLDKLATSPSYICLMCTRLHLLLARAWRRAVLCTLCEQKGCLDHTTPASCTGCQKCWRRRGQHRHNNNTPPLAVSHSVQLLWQQQQQQQLSCPSGATRMPCSAQLRLADTPAPDRGTAVTPGSNAVRRARARTRSLQYSPLAKPPA